MKCNLLFVYVFLMVSSIAWAGEDLAPDASITEIKNFCLSNPGEDYRGKDKSEIWTAISRKRDGDGYADLKCANFEETTLASSSDALKNVDLRGANFDNSYLGSLAIENVDLRGASFDNSRLLLVEFGTSYRDADEVTILNGASFKHAYITGCDFRGVVAKGVDFSYAKMEGNSFHYSELPEAQFVEVEFSSNGLGTNLFIGANLRDSNFFSSRFHVDSVYYASFEYANLEGSNFNGTKWADWEGVHLVGLLSRDVRAGIMERGGGVINLGGIWYEIVLGGFGEWDELWIRGISDPGIHPGQYLRQ